MKKAILLLFIILVSQYLQPTGVVSRDPVKKILPNTIHQKKLANGLQVVTVPYNSPGVVAFYVIMRVGSRDEIESGKTGFAHFFEHMMFRGTEKYSKEAYSNALKAIGASANANTWLDRTVYHMKGNVAKLDKMMELESDRFMNLKYSVQDFKTEAGAVKGEYTKNSANPLERLDEKTNDIAFTNHTYKHTTMGFFKDVVDMPNQYDYSIAFFKKFYRPEYATILVVGDVSPDGVNALAEQYFGKWEKGSYVNNIPVEAAQTETRYTHEEVAGYPPYLGLSYKGPAYSDQSKDCAALNLLCAVLFSERSDLYKKLIINEQKARSLDGYIFNTRDPYLIQIGASVVNPVDLQYVKDQITAEIEKVKTSIITEKTLQETKSRIRYSFALGADSPGAIAEAISSFLWITGDPESLNNYFAQLDNVTAQDLQDMAKKYFTNKGLTISTITADKTGTVK